MQLNVSDNPHKHLIIWLLTGCLLIYLMVIIGGITRLTHSGLSMVEWSPTGSLPPMNEADWNTEFTKYKQSPEYLLINHHFSLADFKNIYLWEFYHRFTGRLIGIVFIIPFIWFIVRKKFPEGFLKKSLVLLALGALQGLLGWYMVKSGLVKNPHVSHYRLAAHLITAFTTFGFTFWYALDLVYPEKRTESTGFKNLIRLLLTLVVIQITYGAFVAGLKAGYIYPTFPMMGNDWLPDDVWLLQPVWKNFVEGAIGVQFIHRCLAYVVTLCVVVIYLRAKNSPVNLLQKKLVNALLFIVLMQFMLGMFTLLMGVPVSLASLHQTGAFFLFSCTLFLLHRT
jgi:cytochrome c oxidase assembly protein subunit 15